jgi:hypothetical protein
VAGPVLERRQFKSAIGEISGVGIKSAGGAIKAHRVFSDPADTLTPKLDAGLAGQDGGQFATTPLGIERAVLEGGLVDEAMERSFQRAGDFGRAT